MRHVKDFGSVFILSRSSQLSVTNILTFFELTDFSTDSSVSLVLGKPSIPGKRQQFLTRHQSSTLQMKALRPQSLHTRLGLARFLSLRSWLQFLAPAKKSQRAVMFLQLLFTLLLLIASPEALRARECILSREGRRPSQGHTAHWGQSPDLAPAPRHLGAGFSTPGDIPQPRL